MAPAYLISLDNGTMVPGVDCPYKPTDSNDDLPNWAFALICIVVFITFVVSIACVASMAQSDILRRLDYTEVHELLPKIETLWRTLPPQLRLRMERRHRRERRYVTEFVDDEERGERRVTIVVPLVDVRGDVGERARARAGDRRVDRLLQEHGMSVVERVARDLAPLRDAGSDSRGARVAEARTWTTGNFGEQSDVGED